jgi:hypothetical protein
MENNFNKKVIKSLFSLFIIFYSLFINSVASQASLQNLAPFTSSLYSNTLSNQESVDSDFIDFSSLKAETYGYEIKFQDATFTANSTRGLELTSQTYYIAQGVKVLKQSFSVSRDWQVSVKAHIASIGKNLPNPYYYSAITIGKISQSYEESLGNHLNLNFTRSKIGSNLSNTINAGMYISGNGNTAVDDDINAEDLHLKVSYHSKNKTCDLSYSYDGKYYNIIKSYNLQQSWSLTASDEVYIALVCTSKPFTDLCEYHENTSLDYRLNAGELHLSNLEITMPATSNSNPVSSNVVGGAPTGGGSPPATKAKKGGKGKASSAKKAGGSSTKSSASKSSGGQKSGWKKKKK